jgi:hypothetical protein
VTENDDERDHLVEMQRNGFENPTYKFFYYWTQHNRQHHVSAQASSAGV